MLMEKKIYHRPPPPALRYDDTNQQNRRCPYRYGRADDPPSRGYYGLRGTMSRPADSDVQSGARLGNVGINT
jgi:hypothetical protein